MRGIDKLEKRNPGPTWGYAFIFFVSRILPWWLMRFVLKLSSLVSLCLMREQRRHSRRFLRDAMAREPTLMDSWRHFSSFAEFLVRRFDVARGSEPIFESDDGSKDCLKKMTDDKEQALHGTFHFGNSDLMGFWLSYFDLSIRMVRYQVGNSSDLKWLEERFGDKVGFLWVNQPEDLLFALKEAVEDGHSIAMKCDRIEHSSKLESFHFLGAIRWFPFTIYHLSILFDLPVVFSFGIPSGRHGTRVYSSTAYRPAGESKGEKLERARSHFQETLKMLENLVREHPYQWFNFLDAIPVVKGKIE
jgi:predicted LPLAT superfamily acyltransferase